MRRLPTQIGKLVRFESRLKAEIQRVLYAPSHSLSSIHFTQAKHRATVKEVASQSQASLSSFCHFHLPLLLPMSYQSKIKQPLLKVLVCLPRRSPQTSELLGQSFWVRAFGSEALSNGLHHQRRQDCWDRDGCHTRRAEDDA